MSRDLLAIVEAAYRHVDDGDAWGKGVVDAASGLDDGFGVLFARVRVGSRFAFEALATSTTDPRIIELVRAPPSLEAPALRVMLASSGRTLSSLLGRGATSRYFAAYASLGMADSLAIQCVDVDRSVVGLYVGLRRERRNDTRTVRRLRLIGIHLAIACRARNHPHDVAWIDPGGRVLDAQGDAVDHRAALALRVRAVEAARTKRSRADLDAALDAWKGLVDGTWSLLERFDSDGRRHFVARRNAPEVAAHLRLSERERTVAELVALGYSQKLTSYSLGISSSMVSAHLSNALLKLGLGSTAELVTLGDGLLREE